MSLRRSVAPSIRAIHPALFPVGFAVVAVQTALSFGLAAVEATLSPVYGPLLTLGGPVLVLVVTVPFAVAVYQPVRDRTDDVTETLTVALRAVRRLYPRVLAATVVAVGVALVAALAVALVAFVIATVAQYARYATGDPAPPNVTLAVWAFPLLFAVSLVAGVLVTRFADAFVAFEGERPRTAWRSSAVFARRRPLSFLGYALVTVVLLGTPQILGFALGRVDEGAPLVVAVAAIVLVGGVGFVLAAALHVTYFERTVLPALQTVPPVRIRWSRVATVAVVLLAAVAGAGYVRAVDAGAGQAEIRALPDDPEAAYAVAANNTREANHRRQVLVRNASDPESTFRTASRSAIDYDDRRLRLRYYDDDGDAAVESFQAEGTIAMPSDGAGSWRRAFGPITSERNDWTVVAMPGYGLSDPADVGPVPDPGADWSVAHSNESVITYRAAATDDIATAFPTSYAGMSGELANDSHLTAVVDRERGVVDSVEIRAHSLETDRVYEYEMRYTAVGTADVERPSEIGERYPAEWLWDVLYY